MAQMIICDVGYEHEDNKLAHLRIRVGAQSHKDVCIDCAGYYLTQELSRVGKEKTVAHVSHIDMELSEFNGRVKNA